MVKFIKTVKNLFIMIHTLQKLTFAGLLSTVLLIASCVKEQVPGTQPFAGGAYIRVINTFSDIRDGSSYPVIFYADNRINTISDSLVRYPADRFGSPFLSNNFSYDINENNFEDYNLDRSEQGSAAPYEGKQVTDADGFQSFEDGRATFLQLATYFPTRLHRVEVGSVYNGIDWYKYARISPGRHRFSFRPVALQETVKQKVTSSGLQSFSTIEVTALPRFIQDTLIDLAEGSAQVLLLDPAGQLHIIPEPVNKVFKPNHGYLRLFNFAQRFDEKRGTGTGLSGPDPIFNSATASVDVYLTKARDNKSEEGPEIPVAMDLRRIDLQRGTLSNDFFELDMTDIVNVQEGLDTVSTSPTFQQPIRYYGTNYFLRLKIYSKGQSKALGNKPLQDLSVVVGSKTSPQPLTADRPNGGAANFFYQFDTSPKGWQPLITTLIFSLPQENGALKKSAKILTFNLEPAGSINFYR
jgi:hypothetical protein